MAFEAQAMQQRQFMSEQLAIHTQQNGLIIQHANERWQVLNALLTINNEHLMKMSTEPAPQTLVHEGTVGFSELSVSVTQKGGEAGVLVASIDQQLQKVVANIAELRKSVSPSLSNGPEMGKPPAAGALAGLGQAATAGIAMGQG